jgi:hypothetical protein
MSMDPREISPELVLVDPELAVVARRLLPDPGAFGRAAPPAELADDARLVPTKPRTGVSRRRRLRRPLVLLAAVSLIVAAVFIGYARSSVPRPSLAPPTTDPRLRQAGPRSAQTIRWAQVRGATYYDLVLWRDGKRVLDLWPTSARVLLHDRLAPGRYRWFVYPGFGAKASQRYGSLAGSGMFVIEQGVDG